MCFNCFMSFSQQLFEGNSMLTSFFISNKIKG